MRTSGKTALLAGPIYVGQARGEEKRHVKRGAKFGPGASLHVFWVGLNSRLKDVFSFTL